ncbi:glycoside hydrolase family 108 protein [Sphingobium sp. YR768]|uniref:glycoside hydrolase family 108 protein n=1 Tax=Sphingobium sp. YR768 TaxID=1884365 RepID=UPI0008C6B2A9|nr:N-acetylmuramidase [Sphingobium sp. YR768]SES19802.1 Predicted Peptidoglycan domain-containing protein [Sphingobium sp. YR768]
MATINAIIEDVLANEGGYVNHKNDLGSETNFGITIATARANGYTGPMKAMTRDFARGIYVKQYVEAPGFDKIAVIAPSIGAELVDTGVNMGPKVAAQFLQRALNGLNNQGKDFADLLVDGSAGQKTRDALTAFIKKRGAEGERRLLALLNALQGERYLSLCEGRSANEAFLFGWLSRIAA